MATHDRPGSESRKMDMRKTNILCLYGCLTACRLRDAVLNRLAFKPPLRVGYALDENGNFLLDAKLWSSQAVSSALASHGLEVSHRYVHTKRKRRLSSILLQSMKDRRTSQPSEGRNNNNRMLVIFSHGNSTDIGYMFPAYVNLCRTHKIDIFAYDYSGYGLSDGDVGEKHLYSDIEYIYNYVRNELRVKPENIVLYGNSLGSAPSSYLASMPDRFPIGGLILDAPLASAIRLQVGHLKRTPRFDAFANIEFLKTKELYPTLILHGTSDGIIPIEHARNLAFVVEIRHAELMQKEGQKLTNPVESSDSYPENCLGSPKQSGIELHKQPEDYLRTWWVPGAGHNNIQFDNTEAYNRTIDTFFKLCETWRINNKVRLEG